MSILLLQLLKKTHFVYHDEQFITIFVMCDKQKEEMERLFESFIKKLAITNTSFVRSLMNEIEWKARLIGIKGARGVGKTTLLLQYIKLNLPMDKTVLYASVDNIWFSEHKLYDLASDFVKRGGKYLFLDEVHKYPNWSQELKIFMMTYLNFM